MNILISVSNLNLGGPTKFILRLANELAKENNVYIYDFYPYLKDIDINSKEYKKIHFLSVKNSKKDNLNWKLNKLISKTFNWNKYWEYTRENNFKHCLKKYDIQVVMSTQKKIDAIVAPIVNKLNIPFTTRLNSDYGIKEKNEYSLKTSQKIFSKLNGIIYTADFHYNNLKSKITLPVNFMETKIMNGIETPKKCKAPKKYPKNIQKNDFVFGMVARGIKEKGWNESINAFLYLQKEKPNCNCHLILVGKGKFLDDLKSTNYSKNIHFVGSTHNPIEWIQQFDVCLLPTYFNNESTPNSIIEYIVCNKPIISTNYVEIPYMMKGRSKIAGELLELNNNKNIDYKTLYFKMASLLNNPKKIDLYTNISKEAAIKFNLKSCSENYLSFFNELINKNHEKSK